MKIDLTTNNNNNNTKKPREIDPLDYDISTGLHYDPIRNPSTPNDYKNDDGEYDYFADAYWIGRVKKDDPRNFTEYLQMWNEYTNTNVYKRRKAVYERYKERLKTCKTKEDYLKALMDYKKDNT